METSVVKRSGKPSRCHKNKLLDREFTELDTFKSQLSSNTATCTGKGANPCINDQTENLSISFDC